MRVRFRVTLAVAVIMGLPVIVSASPDPAPPAEAGEQAWSRASLEDLVEVTSRSAGLDPRLVRALVTVESGWNHRAVSRRGARGLMQLMPATAARLDVDDAFDPAQNVRGGVAELARLVDRYGGNLQLALAAYNAGEGAVAKHRGIPPYRETRNYVRRILSIYTGRAYSYGNVQIRRVPVRVVRNDSSGTTVITNRSAGPVAGVDLEKLGGGGGPLRGGFGADR